MRKKVVKLLHKFIEVIDRFLNKKVRPLGMLPFDRTVTSSGHAPNALRLHEKAPVSLAMAEIVTNYLNSNE